MKCRYQMAALAVVLGGFTAAAQTTILDENFDGGYTGAFSIGTYSGGSPAATSNSVLASGGNPNGCWQESMTTTTTSDYYTGQLQLGQVSGNTDTNPSDYVVSFDAKGSQAATFQFIIQTWPNDYFGGSGPVINATVNDSLTAANAWQTFSVNLSSITTTNPTGATWQFGFQLNAYQWGGADQTDTLTIDNIILKNVAVANAIALTSSVNPSTNGGSVAFTAMVQTNGVTAGNATGQVVFSSAGGPFSTNTVSGGSATSASITNLPVGPDVITAIYSGGNYPASTNTLNQSVNTLGTGQCIVDWNTVYQRIDGFGASSAWLSGMTTAQEDMFFSTNTGIGLSLLRSHIVYASSTSPTAVLSSGETNIMQAAQARGARVWSTPWTPASGFKNPAGPDGGNYLGSGGNLTNLAYAQQLASYVASMQSAYGVSIYAISVQNEPDAAVTSYEACVWTAAQIHDFTTNLYNALVAAGVGSTKIIVPESENWSADTSLYTPTLNDPNTAAVVSIIADHNYDGVNFDTGATTVPAAIPDNGKALWETEVSTGDAFDGSISNAMYWATRIHLFLTSAQVNAWHYWWLISENPDNEGLTDESGNPAKRMFVLGNYSRFVRPGFYRIGATESIGANGLISAYQNTNSGTFAIVAINTNASIAISQTFTLTNCNIASSTVTPWITSGTLNATNSQPPVAVSGSSFTYPLPAMSVVTFVGQAVPITPPTLAPVANQVINAGVTLQVTNVATDPNVPPLTLNFSLLSAPTNAILTALGATNKLLTWRPLVSQANTTNLFTVKVADSGSLSLSATNNFMVKVNPITNAVVIGSVTVSNTRVNLVVSGPQGPDYTLLTTTNLTGTWQASYTNSSPVTPLMLVDTNPTAPARFYRIRIGP